MRNKTFLVVFFVVTLISCGHSDRNVCKHNQQDLISKANSALADNIRFRYTMFQYEQQMSHKQVRLEIYSRLIKNLNSFDKKIEGVSDFKQLIKIETTFLDSVILISQVNSGSYPLDKFNKLLNELDYPIEDDASYCCDTMQTESEKLKARLIVIHLSEYM